MKNIALIALVLLTACSAEVKKPVIDEAVTKEVLERHFKTFKANDLEGIMADYAEEAILITPTATHKGAAAIRENFVRVFKALPTEGTKYETTKTEIARDIAYIIWTAKSPALDFQYASDTFIIVDGKIISQSFAGIVVPVKADTTAVPVAPVK